MSINDYKDPIVSQWNMIDGQKYSKIKENEPHIVVGGMFALTGLPDIQQRVIINEYIEIGDKDEIKYENQFKVDYTNGYVYVHPSKEGQSINVAKYASRGVNYYPSSRIYTKLSDTGDVSETLKDIEIEIDKSLELSKLIQVEENQRISNEKTRIINEDTRENAESNRISNESDRKSNESTRESNESARVQNENNRKDEESTRKTNELVRISNEDTRQANETYRINTEDSRKTNEITRENNETIRQNQEQERQTNTANAINEVNNTNNDFKVWEDYDNLKDYVLMNKVQYQGSSYINIVACKGVLPTDTNHWQLIALKGQDGVGGDMYKSLYDTNNNGKVDIAENAEKLEGKTLAEIYNDIPEGTTVTDSTTNGNIVVNDTEIQVYDDSTVQNNINGLAGEGRTTETIKDNSDKINNLSAEVDEHKADYVQLKEKVNEPAYSTIETYDEVTSMPENTVNGQVSSSVKGLTATNLIKNGDFSNGTTDWTATNTTISIDDNILTIINNANGGFVSSADIPYTLNHKLYTSVTVKADSNLVEISFGGAEFPNNKHSGSGNFERISGIFTYGNSTTTKLRIEDKRISNWTNVYVAKALVINLTATFGAGNEPTKEECDKIFANWFDGTKSTASAMRLKSVGKNLFDSEWKKGGLSLDGSPTSNMKRSGTRGYVPIKGNMQYSVSIGNLFTVDKSVMVLYYDMFYNNIGYSTTVINSTQHTFSFTAPINAKYIKFSTCSDNSTPDLILYTQLEKGTVATPYESYKESTAYVVAKDKDNKIVNLRSVPSAKDEIRMSEGKAIIRTSEEKQNVINGTLEWSNLDTSGLNHYCMQALIPNSITNIAKAIDDSVVAMSNDGSYKSTSVTNEDTRLINFGHSPSVLNNAVYIKIEKTKIDVMTGETTIDKFKNYLNQYPITLTYQLAEPEIIPLTVGGTVQAFENGTVIIEPYIKEEFVIPSTTITLPFPITNIDKIEKLVNSKFVEVMGTLSTDGKTITVDTAGKYRVRGAIRSEESAQGQKILQVPINLNAQVNSNAKSIRMLSDKTIDLQDKVDILLILNS